MSLGTAQLLDTRALTKSLRFSSNDKDWSRIAQLLHGIDALEETFATQSRASTRTARMLQALIGTIFSWIRWSHGGFLGPMGSGNVPLRTRVGKVVSHGDSSVCRVEQSADANLMAAQLQMQATEFEDNYNYYYY
eukprot:341569-Amphidinium_carterae.3